MKITVKIPGHKETPKHLSDLAPFVVARSSVKSSSVLYWKDKNDNVLCIGGDEIKLSCGQNPYECRIGEVLGAMDVEVSDGD